MSGLSMSRHGATEEWEAPVGGGEVTEVAVSLLQRWNRRCWTRTCCWRSLLYWRKRVALTSLLTQCAPCCHSTVLSSETATRRNVSARSVRVGWSGRGGGEGPPGGHSQHGGLSDRCTLCQAGRSTPSAQKTGNQAKK